MYIIFFSSFALLFNLCKCEYERNGWQAAANYLLQGLDESVNPCENFVDFACGNWNKSSASKGFGYSQAERNRHEINDHFLSALIKVNVTDPVVPEFKKWLKQFFMTCLTMSRAEEVIVKDIYDSVAKHFLPSVALNVKGRKIYPWEANYKNNKTVFWRFVGTVQRIVNTKFLIKSDVYGYENDDELECQKIATLAIQPNLQFEISDDMLKLFFKKTLGKSTKNAETIVAEMNALNNDLGTMNNWIEDITEELMTIEELQDKVPEIDWLAYFDGLLPEPIKWSWLTGTDTTVNVICMKELKKMADIIDKYDPIVLYNLAYAVVLQRYQDQYIKGTFVTFDENVEDAEKAVEQHMCLDFAYRYYTAATTRLLFDEYNVTVKQWHDDVQLIGSTVKSAFYYLIYSMDWMDAVDKVKIVKKVQNIGINFRLPQWLTDDEVVKKKTPPFDASASLVANDAVAQKFLYEQQMRPLATALFVEPVPSFVENAYYSNVEPQMIINLGNELPPLHRIDYPTAVKYGHTGWTIGHELCHGFDNEGIKEGLNWNQNNTDWLSQETLELYKQQEKCFVQQYSKFCYEDINKCVSGPKTMRDNIADVEGLKVAYMAYRFASQLLPKENPLPGELEKYSWDQIFFMTAARDYCGITEIVNEDLKDSHAPPRVRIETAMSNFPLFAKVFNCPVGSRYAPIQTCTVWGNYWD